MSIGAAILAGGRNSRMNGQSKADLIIRGKAVIEKIYNEMDCFDEIIISYNGNDKYGNMGIVIMDAYQNCGPIGGLYSALKNCRSDKLFIIACDMPLVRNKSIHIFCNLYNVKYDGAVLVDQNGQLQPLFGIYKKKLYQYFEDRIKEKDYSVRKAVEKLKFQYINSETISADNNEFFNMNTPEDYYKLTGHML